MYVCVLYIKTVKNVHLPRNHFYLLGKDITLISNAINSIQMEICGIPISEEEAIKEMKHPTKYLLGGNIEKEHCAKLPCAVYCA